MREKRELRRGHLRGAEKKKKWVRRERREEQRYIETRRIKLNKKGKIGRRAMRKNRIQEGERWENERGKCRVDDGDGEVKVGSRIK